MHPLINAHLAHLRLAGYRPESVRARSVVLTAWDNNLADHGLDLVTATRLHVEAWLGREGLALATRRAYRSHLRGLYRWAKDEGHLSADPTDRVPPVRVPRGAPRPLDHDHLVQALDTADLRMRAWLLLMALCGLRCLEVAGLRPEDVRVEPDGTGLLFLRVTKGGASAWQPAHPEVLRALRALPVRGGVWWDCSPRQVGVAVAAHLQSCGITATAHQLRHSAATLWYRASGGDLLVTQQLLRHANPQSTAGYAALDPTRPAEVVRLVAVPA